MHNLNEKPIKNNHFLLKNDDKLKDMKHGMIAKQGAK
jgi:hypothetical protein